MYRVAKFAVTAKAREIDAPSDCFVPVTRGDPDCHRGVSTRWVAFLALLALSLFATFPTHAAGVLGDAIFDSGFEQAVAPPVDFIVIADNSTSMADELSALETALTGMADALASNNYHLILVSQRGEAPLQLCPAPPLAAVAGCASPPVATQRFAHYDLDIGSTDALCRVLAAMPPEANGGVPDAAGIFPYGILSLLRVHAFKSFVVVTDDGVACASFNDDNTIPGGEGAAASFQTQLLTLPGGHFGTADTPRYAMFQIGGVQQADPTDAGIPSLPDAPITTSTCATAAQAGTGYQAIARATHAYRFSVCATEAYAEMLHRTLELSATL